MVGVMTALVGIIMTLTGFGVGAFVLFAYLANDVHNSPGGDLPSMVVPLHPASSVFRSMSPVAGCVIVAVASAGVSPMATCRRTCLPLCLGFLVIFNMDLAFDKGVFNRVKNEYRSFLWNRTGEQGKTFSSEEYSACW